MWRPRDRERYIGGYDPEHEMPDPDRPSGGRWQSDAYRHNARDSRFAYRMNPDRFERQFERNAPQRWDAGDPRDRGYGYGPDYGRDSEYRSNYGREDYDRGNYDRNPGGYRPRDENRPGYGFEREYGRGNYGPGDDYDRGRSGPYGDGYGGSYGGGYGRSNYGGADRGWDRYSPNQHYDRWSADRGADHDYWTTRGGRTPFDDDRDRDRGYGRNFDWDDDWRSRR